jgi:hypothetical protein
MWENFLIKTEKFLNIKLEQKAFEQKVRTKSF